ncbi:MAG: Gldg family protein, partial [Thermoguttaceae bacterium]
SDFGHGLITWSGIFYFLAVVVVMLYLSMVFISRRHWVTGREGGSMSMYYLLRFLSLIVIAVSATVVFARHDWRLDVTAEKLSSLAPQTKEILAKLKYQRPVQIDAFISPEVPEDYVQTRLNLLTTLRELKALGKGMIRVTVHNTEPLSGEASLAETRFGIEPRKVPTSQHGVMSFDNIFLGVAVTSGLEKVILPFIDRGIPIEYEMIRSLGTVTSEKRKKIAVLTTDAKLFGNLMAMGQRGAVNWPIIDELEKQYEVAQLDCTVPITEKFDALLAVQPSSLAPEQMKHFIAAVENGQPTAIFEDPLPVFAANVPGTSMPKRPPGGMQSMFMGMRPKPKGDIRPLWNLLGIDFMANDVIWQDYNPYPKSAVFPEEFVFVDKGEGNKKPFSTESNISSGLQQVLFPFPGAVSKIDSSSLKFTPLVTTGDKTGIVSMQDVMNMTPYCPRGLNEERHQIPTFKEYILAAEIQGKIKSKTPAAEEKRKESDDSTVAKGEEKESAAEKKTPSSKETDLHAVVVSDIDMLSGDFFKLREMGPAQDRGVSYQFDNVNLVLNVLDKLAKDERFIEIRKRQPQHRTLTRIDEQTKAAEKEAAKAHEKFLADVAKVEEEGRKTILDTINELKSRKNVDNMQMLIEVQMMQEDLNRKLEIKLKRIKDEKEKDYNKIETALNRQKLLLQNQYKMWAVILPPIPPLFVAIVVFSLRRRREREGVAKSRLR